VLFGKENVCFNNFYFSFLSFFYFRSNILFNLVDLLLDFSTTFYSIFYSSAFR